MFPESVPCELPKDEGTRQEIELKPGSRYCVMKKWSLPREEVLAIDKFFAYHLASGYVRDSISPHCSPTFCVRKATGGWRILHAYNKLNAATVPVQTPIPRKDVIIDGMAKSTIFSSMDMKDGFYHILMRERDIPFTAVSTPAVCSGNGWLRHKGLVIPSHIQQMRHKSVETGARFRFELLYGCIRAMGGKTDVAVHRTHVHQGFTLMRNHKLYASLKKCI